MSSAREIAVANENRSLDQSQQRAIAARNERDAPKNALQAMAARLKVSPARLKETLMATAFSECRNDEEFMALVLVANEYDLNPLLKEIYAFPARGKGIVPMVSVDGWISLMNRHSEFDGIEFENIVDEKGDLSAIEAIIYRKDRKHPIKVMEMLSENKMNTDPWKNRPSRMLRHRALIQAARVAFGFTGISDEGDAEIIDITPQRATRLPDNEEIEAEVEQTTAEYLDDSIPALDEQPEKESSGMTEVDEETARKLDAGEVVDAEPEPERDDLADLRARLAEAKAQADVAAIDADFQKIRVRFSDEEADEMQKQIDSTMAALRPKESK